MYTSISKNMLTFIYIHQNISFFQGKHIRKILRFKPDIQAFDQDSINSTLIYDIISGNERSLFTVNPTSGDIFLEREIDLEEESLPGNTFVLQLEARQQDSPLKRAVARVEIEIMDLNDNAPEFEVDLYNISIVENLPSGFRFVLICLVEAKIHRMEHLKLQQISVLASCK